MKENLRALKQGVGYVWHARCKAITGSHADEGQWPVDVATCGLE